jgi:hypothetical protein
VEALNPALAAAVVGVSDLRKLMYNLIWQSVMWRPGKQRFLIGVKNRLISRPPRRPGGASLRKDRVVARFATALGLRPPSVANPATSSHLD